MATKLKPAFTGYTSRGPIGPSGTPMEPDEIWAAYERYAKMGYKAIDGTPARLPGDKTENLKRLNGLGLTCLCGGTPGIKQVAAMNDAEFDAAMKTAVENCHFYGVKYANIAMSSVISSFGTYPGNWGCYDNTMYDIEILGKVCAALDKEGIIPVYHNHFQEYLQTYKGVSVMDYFFMAIPSFKLKCDLGWVAVGGLDPVEYLEKVKDRIGLLHFKDFTEVKQPRNLVNSIRETDFGFCALGTGILDLKGLMKKALEIGQEWVITEQDRCRNMDWADSIHCAYYNMKETGYLE